MRQIKRRAAESAIKEVYQYAKDEKGKGELIQIFHLSGKQF